MTSGGPVGHASFQNPTIPSTALGRGPQSCGHHRLIHGLTTAPAVAGVRIYQAGNVCIWRIVSFREVTSNCKDLSHFRTCAWIVYVSNSYCAYSTRVIEDIETY